MMALPFINCAEPNAKATKLTLEISNISDDEGQLVVSIYNAENQFPDNPIKIINIPKQKNSETSKTKLLLEEGNYAIIVLNDTNTNGKMDYRFGVYPKEAFGFSNNAKVKGVKRPSFKDCLFTVDNNKMLKVSIRLNEI